jgi:zinc protease
MIRIAGWAALCALALCATPLRAQDAKSTAGLARLLTPEEGRLKNGLRVLSLVDPQAQVSTFQVWYDTGSRNERPGITGISHLCEHLMFKGTKTVKSEELAQLVQAVGGVNNAFTTWDVTCYWEALPPAQLELAARLEADRMSNLALTPETLATEREVVKEERRLRTDNSPLGRALELLTATAYDSNPYHWPTVGWMHDLDAITLEDCKDYYAIHYAPDKALVLIAGPTTHADNLKLVEKYFAKLKPGRPAPRVATGEVTQRGERRSELRIDVQLPILLAGFKVRPDSSSDTAALEVLSTLLSTGQSSRVYKKMIYEKQSALFAGGLALGRKDIGLFYVFAAAKPGVSRDSVEAQLFGELERLATETVSEKELARAKTQLEAQFVNGLETVQDRANVVGIAALVTGDAKAAAGRLARLQAVTAEDVQRVAQARLSPANRTLVWVLPRTGSGS